MKCSFPSLFSVSRKLRSVEIVPAAVPKEYGTFETWYYDSFVKTFQLDLFAISSSTSSSDAERNTCYGNSDADLLVSFPKGMFHQF